MVPYVVGVDVVVASVFASQNKSTVGVYLDNPEAFSVGHPHLWVIGAGHHRIAGEDVQSVASGGRIIIGFQMVGFDALGLDVRVEGCGLVIGGHGDRHTAASCNI